MPAEISVILVGTMIVVAFLVFFLLSKSKMNRMQHFDEMQLLIRAKAYRNAFYTVICGLVVLMFLSTDFIGLDKLVDAPTQMCTVLMAGIMVFAIYCIKKEAFFGIDYDNKSYVYLIFGIGALNLVMGIWRVIDGTILEDGVIKFTHGASNLIMGVGFFVVFVALLLKKADGKSEVDE